MGLQTSFSRTHTPQDLLRLIEAFGESEPVSIQESYGLRARKPYEPSFLSSRKILLSDETLGAISSFEIEATRCDTLIGTSELGPALARAMARTDGIFVSMLNGRVPDYRVCCYLDYLSMTDGEKDERGIPASTVCKMTSADAQTVRASQCAHSIEALVYGIMRERPEVASFTPGRIVKLHAAIGKSFHPTRMPGIRLSGMRDAWSSDRGDVSNAYRPPAPERLPEYLQDIVDFANGSSLGPTIKSALVYYQLEATRMFPDDNDQLGRIMLVCTWKNDGLIQHIMPPISITPAIAMRNHAQVLRPYLYKQGESEMPMIDNWMYHAARASLNAFKIEQACYAEASRIIEQWEQTLAQADVRITRTVHQTLIAMVGMPVFSISLMAKLTEASFSSTAHVVDVLVQHGIVVQKTEGKRNRVYECPAFLSPIEAMCNAFEMP